MTIPPRIGDPGANPAENAATRRRKLAMSGSLLIGILVAGGAIAAGVAATGIGASYFFQPTGALIVLGGTFGVLLMTTPWPVLAHALRRAAGLLFGGERADRAQVLEQLIALSRTVRARGLLAIEPEIDGAADPFLRDALLLVLDVQSRGELESALENKVRLAERHSEADAKVFEVAGGFTPAIGVLGTVVGLIDVLRQFSSLTAVAYGIGAAFTSTMYGLALANLILLPAAHRIRSCAAETFELQELIMEGTLCLFDGIHPRMLRQRLESFMGPAPEPAHHSALPAAPISESGL